jgi:hypothetical protein
MEYVRYNEIIYQQKVRVLEVQIASYIFIIAFLWLAGKISGSKDARSGVNERIIEILSRFTTRAPLRRNHATDQK